MIEGFLGYLLCWGQMFYWGITVMINIVAVLPCCGIIIAELIWSAAWVILIGGFISFYSLLCYSFSIPFTNPLVLLLWWLLSFKVVHRLIYV